MERGRRRRRAVLMGRLSLESEQLLLKRELHRERRELYRSERADIEGRVCDRERWLKSMRLRHDRIGLLESELARVTGELDAEQAA